MRTAVIALTKNGSELAARLAEAVEADLYVKPSPPDLWGNSPPAPLILMRQSLCEKEGERPLNISGSFQAFVGSIFAKYDALVFVMACGIVVRAIAPYIKSKTVDPAVVVMDEKGKHAISLLSGHIGGANRLAAKLASITGGTPVITTSTDVNEVIAFDLFAADNNCIIENIGNLKYISSELVNGGSVGLYSDYEIKGTIPANVVIDESASDLKCHVILSNSTHWEAAKGKALYIRPKNLILGIGCKRGTSKEKISQAVEDFMGMNQKSILSIKCAATVDVKKDEAGILEFCGEKGFELKIVLREEIKEVEMDFTSSDFVKEKIGVSGVAEPCSVLAGNRARLICKKTVYDGITLALSEEEKEFYI